MDMIESEPGNGLTQIVAEINKNTGNDLRRTVFDIIRMFEGSFKHGRFSTERDEHSTEGLLDLVGMMRGVERMTGRALPQKDFRRIVTLQASLTDESLQRKLGNRDLWRKLATVNQCTEASEEDLASQQQLAAMREAFEIFARHIGAVGT